MTLICNCSNCEIPKNKPAIIIVESKTPPKENIAIGCICFCNPFQLVCNAPAKSKNPNKTSKIILSMWALAITNLISLFGKFNQSLELKTRRDKIVESKNKPITKGSFKIF